jgi:hypothetical protein
MKVKLLNVLVLGETRRRWRNSVKVGAVYTLSVDGENVS